MRRPAATGLRRLHFARRSVGASKVETNPVVITFGVTALFMAACRGWCLLWSFRWIAEKLMKAA
jgi:hypothetical protein